MPTNNPPMVQQRIVYGKGREGKTGRTKGREKENGEL